MEALREQGRVVCGHEKGHYMESGHAMNFRWILENILDFVYCDSSMKSKLF